MNVELLLAAGKVSSYRRESSSHLRNKIENKDETMASGLSQVSPVGSIQRQTKLHTHNI